MRKKKNGSSFPCPDGVHTRGKGREISQRKERYYTRNLAKHKRRSLNRTLLIEDLEEREVFSAVSPVTGMVVDTTSLMDTSAIYASATVTSETTLDVEASQAALRSATPQGGAPTIEPRQGEATDHLFASEESAMLGMLASERSLFNPSGMPGGGGIPANYRPSIPGIPGTDTGGVAGDNGGGRLPLEIPGFRGYGNAYYLDINDETLPRTVWLYAQYFRNQPRVTPGQVWLVRPDIDYSWANYHFDGVRISTNVYSMITDEALEELKQEKIEEIMQQEKRDEKVQTFLRKENQMEKQIPKTLQETMETKETPPIPSSPPTDEPLETDLEGGAPMEVPHPQETPRYPVPQPQTPATPPIVDPPAPKPMRSDERLEGER